MSYLLVWLRSACFAGFSQARATVGSCRSFADNGPPTSAVRSTEVSCPHMADNDQRSCLLEQFSSQASIKTDWVLFYTRSVQPPLMC